MTTNPTPDTGRLHDRILSLEAELAQVRDLLRSENKRANDAIDREETAEEAALEAQQERDQLRTAASAVVAVAAPPTGQTAEAVQYWFDAATERREERDRLRAVVARVAQMADAWEQQLPEVIRTPAVVSALRAALESADDLLRRLADEAQAAPDVVAAIVDALTKRAGELSELAEEEMRPSLEERAQEWHAAVDVARRAAKAATTPAKAPQPFTPPAHYRGRDGTAYCVHAVPVGPDSCRHCRELADDAPASAVVSAVPPQPEEKRRG